MSPADDVVITGIGCRSPIGGDRETFWRRLLAGDSGVRSLNVADFHGLALPGDCNFPLIGAPADFTDGNGDAEPVVRLIDVAADESLSHAGLAAGDFDPTRGGCVIGTSKGGLVAFARSFADRRGRTSSRNMWANIPPHVGSTSVAARLNLLGPCLAPVAACATGLVSVLRGCDLIRNDLCDVVLAGSGDASLHPAVLASFRRMGVLSTHFETPAAACRPFNIDRDGFVVGEGAAVFVLERRRNAMDRGARPVATVIGGAVLSDPSGLTSVDPSGTTLSRAIRDTLLRTRRTVRDIGHINLHGTATRANDVAESNGLHAAFGQRIEDLHCVALKGAIGHQLGAAGAVELVATVLALRDGRLPPTVNLTAPDPECPLPLSSGTVSVRGCGLKISLGFGGHVAIACLGPA
ncbi:MAG: beta-ketoacyl-[acyl-carrier-protein] synthase family protein [Planctomycetaceae bacterium]